MPDLGSWFCQIVDDLDVRLFLKSRFQDTGYYSPIGIRHG